MKHSSLFLLLVLCFSTTLYAQKSKRIKLYRTWVSFENGAFLNQRHAFYQTGESSILLSNSLKRSAYEKSDFKTIELDIKDIQQIRVRKKTKILNGALIGFASGAATGAIIGFASGDDVCSGSGGLFSCWWLFTAEEKALIAAIPMSLLGAGIGAAIGVIKVKIPINGSQETYAKQRDRLNKFAIKQGD